MIKRTCPLSETSNNLQELIEQCIKAKCFYVGLEEHDSDSQPYNCSLFITAMIDEGSR